MSDFGMMNGQMPQIPQGYAVENIFSKEGDERRTAIFHVEPIPNAKKSMEAGYTVSDDVLMCKHYTIGEMNLQCKNEPATDELKRRYSKQWEWYVKTQGQPGERSGMDLTLLFPASPSLVQRLRANGIYTVEELASIEAQGMAQVGMGAMEWKAKAVKFLEQAKDTAAVSKLNAELAKRDEKIDALMLQVQQLTQAMNQRYLNGPVMNDDGQMVEEPPPVRRGPGRPRRQPPPFSAAAEIENEEVT